MSYTLRAYQTAGVRAGISFFRSAKTVPSIIVAPTAAGKSLYIANIAKHTPDRILVLQPSVELLRQNFEKYVAYGSYATMYSASVGQKNLSNTVFATLGSIKNMGDIFKFRGFKKIIIDEIDRYPRGTGSMLSTFLKESGIHDVLGLTATPLKLQSTRNSSRLVMLTSKNGDPDSHFFKKIIHVTQVQEIVSGGFWSPLVYETHTFDSSRLQFNNRGDEYLEESVRISYEQNRIGEKIIARIKAMPERRSILVFVPSVKEAQRLSSLVASSEVVHAETPASEREKIVDRFKKRLVRVIFNVSALSVGFDAPCIDAIIDGKSTASFALYYQKLGRGTRLDPTGIKKDCLIVDFCGTIAKFGRLEYIRYVKEGVNWKLYGENDMLITGIPVDQIGRHTSATETAKKEARGKGIKLNSIVKPREGDPIKILWGRFKDTEVKKCPRWFLEGLLDGKGPVRKKANEFIFAEAERVLGRVKQLVEDEF